MKLRNSTQNKADEVNCDEFQFSSDILQPEDLRECMD